MFERKQWVWVEVECKAIEGYASGLSLHWDGRLLFHWPIGPLTVMWQGPRERGNSWDYWVPGETYKHDISMPYFRECDADRFFGSVSLSEEPDEFVFAADVDEKKQFAIAVNGFEGANVDFWLEYEDGRPEDPAIIAQRREYKCPMMQLQEIAARSAEYSTDDPAVLAAMDFSSVMGCDKHIPKGSKIEGCNVWGDRCRCWKAFDAWEKTKTATDRE